MKKYILFYLITLIYIILFLFFYLNFYNNNFQTKEPFISSFYSNKHKLSRNLRYGSQHLQKYFNDYIHKIKKFLYK